MLGLPSRRNVLFLIVGIVLAIALPLLFPILNFSPYKGSPTVRLDAVEQIKNVLQLGVIETRVSQIYEVRKDNLTIKKIPIPWTKQRSILGVKGSVMIGYDLEKAEVLITDRKKNELEVRLPDPSILSVDLDYHFIQEDDSFLNRLTPDDRNKILEGVKREVRKDLLNPKTRSSVEHRTDEMLKNFEKAYGLTIQVKHLPPPV